MGEHPMRRCSFDGNVWKSLSYDHYVNKACNHVALRLLVRSVNEYQMKALMK